MTPEERHALADRLDADAEWHTGECAQKHANYGGARGCCADANAAHDLRAAAAALREMPSTEEVVTAARASLWEQMESEAVERLTAEVARLREGIERHRGACYDANSNDERLHALLDAEGGTDDEEWDGRESEASDTEASPSRTSEPQLERRDHAAHSATRSDGRNAPQEDSIAPTQAAVERVIAGALRNTIDAHGPIAKDRTGSAAKRVRTQVDAVWKLVPADAVVIPRSAIPDDVLRVAGFLDSLAEAYLMGELEDEGHDPGSSALCARAADLIARLLSGATTEGDEG